MYSLFLDPSMTYSCGIHTGPGESLEQAQYNKLDAVGGRGVQGSGFRVWVL
jgi:cyclopropane fatty-acyl-phospholipid synthase-like methyltransferase